jgi:hypothetical protein
MRTEIFATQALWTDASRLRNVNGVNPAFAENNPNWREMNTTNSKCWNCLNCENCQSCTACRNCRYCEDCFNSENCSNCLSCYHCTNAVSCDNLLVSTNCINCVSRPYICEHMHDCENCVRCSDCRNCKDCIDCLYCNGCDDCKGCRRCTNCVGKSNLTGITCSTVQGINLRKIASRSVANDMRALTTAQQDTYLSELPRELRTYIGHSNPRVRRR